MHHHDDQENVHIVNERHVRSCSQTPSPLFCTSLAMHDLMWMYHLKQVSCYPCQQRKQYMTVPPSPSPIMFCDRCTNQKEHSLMIALSWQFLKTTLSNKLLEITSHKHVFIFLQILLSHVKLHKSLKSDCIWTILQSLSRTFQKWNFLTKILTVHSIA